AAAHAGHQADSGQRGRGRLGARDRDPGPERRAAGRVHEAAEGRRVVSADTRARLAELGLELPPVTPPAASYIPAVRTGNLVYVSGQLPIADGKLMEVGKVGAEVSAERANDLAARCALNGL